MIMKLKNIIRYTKIYGLMLLTASITLCACISEGDETIVLEESQATASQLILGEWELSSYKITDEEGNPINEPGIENGVPTIPAFDFKDDNTCLITPPNEAVSEGKYDISEDGSVLWVEGYGEWEIFSLGKNKLVLTREIIYNGKTYNVMYILERNAPGEDSPNDNLGGEVGSVDDNNPYQPWAHNLVSQITMTRHYTSNNSIEKTVYKFQYDVKSRIIEYTIDNYDAISNMVTESNKFNFTYDDSKVYLYYNEELMNTGVVGHNGFLDYLYEGNSDTASSFFDYNADGYVTYLETNGEKWNPIYSTSWSGAKNMASPTDGGDELSYNSDAINNASVDFNGLMTSCYQWEWSMHNGYSGVVLGLFDFYGKRSYQVASKVVRNSLWIDEMTDWEITKSETGDYIITFYEITRSGSNHPFTATYEIEYYH